MTVSPARKRLLPLPVKARLTPVLAVPILLLVAGTGVGAALLLESRDEARATAGHAGLVLAAQDLVHSLQRERGLTMGLLAGETHFQAELAAGRRATDRARAALERLPADRLVSPRFHAALGELATVSRMRSFPALTAAPATTTTGAGTGALPTQAVPGHAPTPQQAFASFTDVIAAITDASFVPGVEPGDPALARNVRALEALCGAKEAAAQERATATAAFAAGSFQLGEHLRFLESRAARAEALRRFRWLATPVGRSALARAETAHVAHPTESLSGTRDHAHKVPVARFAEMEREAVEGGDGGPLSTGPRTWHAATAPYDDALREAVRAVGAQVRTTARAAEERDTWRLTMLGAAAATSMAGLAALGVLTIRSILRPLRRLAGRARALAGQVSSLETDGAPAARRETGDRPPARAGEAHALTGGAPTRRGDEFAEVAGALGDIHRSTVRLAAERTALRRDTTESFADLGLRHRDLVHRQLSFIGVLQRDETDPATLARLCELDRLTSRLRRNAETLLVLAGKRGPRRSSEPVPVADVVRSALTEIEEHDRVTLRVVEGAPVRGAVVAEIAHVLAELLENALTFSPPGSEVEVWVRTDEGECRITITDHGVGMTSGELATANARLRGEGSFLAAPARCLGHYVVGRLAERLGVRVWLHESMRRGVTVQVVLPEELLAVTPAFRPPPELLGGVSAR